MQVNLTNAQALRVLAVLEDKIAALHNHIASAVESPSTWQGNHSARALVDLLREHQDIATLVRRAKREAEEAGEQRA